MIWTWKLFAFDNVSFIMQRDFGWKKNNFMSKTGELNDCTDLQF